MRKLYLILCSAFILTACAPPRPAAELPVNEVIPIEKRQAVTKQINAFTISGAMSARNSKKAWTATMNWTQRSPSNFQMKLFGPLGAGAVHINKRGRTVTFKDGKKTVSSTNATQMLYQQTGIRLPVGSLSYWVRGLPAPGSVQSKKFDRYNHLSQLRQNGYTIQYTKYTSVNNIDLPSKIKLTGHGVTIKVVIKRWRV